MSYFGGGKGSSKDCPSTSFPIEQFIKDELPEEAAEDWKVASKGGKETCVGCDGDPGPPRAPTSPALVFVGDTGSSHLRKRAPAAELNLAMAHTSSPPLWLIAGESGVSGANGHPQQRVAAAGQRSAETPTDALGHGWVSSWPMGVPGRAATAPAPAQRRERPCALRCCEASAAICEQSGGSEARRGFGFSGELDSGKEVRPAAPKNQASLRRLGTPSEIFAGGLCSLRPSGGSGEPLLLRSDAAGGADAATGPDEQHLQATVHGSSCLRSSAWRCSKRRCSALPNVVARHSTGEDRRTSCKPRLFALLSPHRLPIWLLVLWTSSLL
jgi:hypothetical protein